MIRPTYIEIYGVYELEDGDVKVFKVPLDVIPTTGGVLSVYGHRVKRVIGHTLEESCANGIAERYKKGLTGLCWQPTKQKQFCCKSGYEKYKLGIHHKSNLEKVFDTYKKTIIK